MKIPDGIAERAGASSPHPASPVPRPTPDLHARQSAPRRVVFALTDAERPTASLRRAVAFAHTLDARLHIVCVLSGVPKLRTLLSRRSVAPAARTVEVTLLAERGIREWLKESLGSESSVEHLAIAHGRFVERAAVYAASVASRLIILPASARRLSGMVTSLAGAAQIPVLVAHERPGKRAIVAATDLESNGYPVLREAAELVQRLDAELVALHNVEPRQSSVAGGVWDEGSFHSSVVHTTRAAELAKAARKLCIDAQTVVLDEVSSARAILAEAQSRDADVVVLGTRRHGGWLDELGSRRVVNQVIERASCSVFVLPLDGARPR